MYKWRSATKIRIRAEYIEPHIAGMMYTSYLFTKPEY
jgi:hypothetical protein